MAHYAFLDENNIVTEVIVGIDENELIDGLTPEKWYEKLRNKKCVRTSYNKKIRANFAGIGDYYDKDFDVFIKPKPYPSWVLDYHTFSWKPPVEQPISEEGFRWKWFEYSREWIKVPVEK